MALSSTDVRQALDRLVATEHELDFSGTSSGDALVLTLEDRVLCGSWYVRERALGSLAASTKDPGVIEVFAEHPSDLYHKLAMNPATSGRALVTLTERLSLDDPGLATALAGAPWFTQEAFDALPPALAHGSLALAGTRSDQVRRFTSWRGVAPEVFDVLAPAWSGTPEELEDVARDFA
jgi:hypothetical protein